jgi:hypothetical protein
MFSQCRAVGGSARTVAGLGEAVRRVAVRGEDGDLVAAALQADGGVNDQLLGAAYAQVWVQEGNRLGHGWRTLIMLDPSGRVRPRCCIRLSVNLVAETKAAPLWLLAVASRLPYLDHRDRAGFGPSSAACLVYHWVCEKLLAVNCRCLHIVEIWSIRRCGGMLRCMGKSDARLATGR